MILKSRIESDELKIFRLLNSRGLLSDKEKQYYLNLEKGYEGEVKFDQLTENLQEERLILNDLLLEINHSYFQIDTLLISQGGINLYDVKNYEENYNYQDGNFFKVGFKSEIKNPLEQLNRSETLLRQLLHKLKSNYPIEKSLVFINPEFTLYQAPLNQPIIFHSQLNSYMENLNSKTSKLDDDHKRLAHQILSQHHSKNPFTRFPSYDFNSFPKGITCASCDSLSVSVEKKKIVCKDCGETESIESGIIRTVEEIKLLFPDLKITTRMVHNWCGVIESEKTIRRILKLHYRSIGNTSFRYFE